MLIVHQIDNVANDGNKAGIHCSLLATVNSKEVIEKFIFKCKDKRSKAKVLSDVINPSAKNVCELTRIFIVFENHLIYHIFKCILIAVANQLIYKRKSNYN